MQVRVEYKNLFMSMQLASMRRVGPRDDILVGMILTSSRGPAGTSPEVPACFSRSNRKSARQLRPTVHED